jgi:hypothetical protein
VVFKGKAFAGGSQFLEPSQHDSTGRDRRAFWIESGQALGDDVSVNELGHSQNAAQELGRSGGFSRTIGAGDDDDTR